MQRKLVYDFIISIFAGINSLKLAATLQLRKKMISDPLGTPENIPITNADNYVGVPPPEKNSVWGRLVRLVFRVCLVLLLLFFTLVFVLQIPAVQQKIIDTSSNYLSKKLNTKVKIDEFSVNFVGDITINGLYVGNQFAPEDTLLSIKKLDSGLNPAYVPLGVFQLRHLSLSDVVLRLKHEKGKKDDNLAFIISFFNPTKDKKKNQPQSPLPDIRVALISVHNIEVDNNDEIEGRRITVRLEDLKLETNFMNLPNKLVDIDNIIVNKPDVNVQESLVKPAAISNQLPANNSVTNDEKLTGDSSKLIADKTEKNFRFSISAVNIVDGKFKLNKWQNSLKRHTVAHAMDFDHLNVVDANIFLHNWIYFNDEWTGVIDGVHAVEANGFELKKLISDNVHVTSTMTEFAGVRIETNNSILGDTFRMIYRDPSAFKDFDNLVTMQATIKSPKVTLDDIMAFAPDLENNSFFKKNRKEIAVFNVNLVGTINSLKLLPFSVKIGKGFSATGKFSSRDLKNHDETFISLALSDLKTSMTSLRELIPDFVSGNNFNKLGNLSFNGNFEGFFKNFSASGNLITDLGAAAMDMDLKPYDNGKMTTYKGNLALLDFDLGKFSDNKDLGKVSLKTTITNGSGSKKENVKLDFVNTVNDFSFKNYVYKNLGLSGHYENKKFVGKIESKDENADFKFDGTVDIAAARPVFKFSSTVTRMDLKTLGFLPDDIVVGGDFKIDLTGNKLSNIVGYIKTDSIRILKNKTEKYKIDSLDISMADVSPSSGQSVSQLIQNQPIVNNRLFSINSGFLTARIEGQFNLENILEDFKTNFYRFHPGIATDLKLIPKDNGRWVIDTGSTSRTNSSVSLVQSSSSNAFNTEFFNLDIHVLDTRNLTSLFDKKLGAIKKLDITGRVDNSRDIIDWSVSTPEKITYDNILIENFAFTGNGKGTFLNWDVHAGEVKIGTDQSFKGITFQNNLKGDTVQLGLTSQKFSESLHLDQLELNAVLMKRANSYQLNFLGNQQSKLNLLGDTWAIDKSNLIEFFKDSVNIQNFLLQNNQRSIAFESFGRKGLKVNLDNFNLSFANKFLQDPRFPLSGEFDVRAQIEDLINVKNFSASATVDTLTVKNENRGTLKLNVSGKDITSPIAVNLQLSDLSRQPSDVNRELSEVSRQISAISKQLSVISRKPGTNIEKLDSTKLTIQNLKTPIDSVKLIENKSDSLKLIATNLKRKSDSLSVKADSSKLTIAGYFYPTARDTFAAQSLDMRFDVSKFPFDNLHYLIDTGASEFRGYMDGYLRIDGPLKKLNSNGELHLKDGHVVIDYLKIPINIKDSKIRITNDKIDVSGDTIYDRDGNKGLVFGGLKHNHLQDMGPNLVIQSKKFVFLNTQRSDNPLFYGVAQGEGDVSITGSFQKTDIRVRASADEGTSIVFPFGTEQTVKESGFIVFKNTNKIVVDTFLKSKNSSDIQGMSFDMELNIKEPAVATMVLDENAGDNIRSHGTGDVHFNLSRTGSVTMDGEYRIEQGDYVFKLAKIVTKNFAIKQGGTIRWNGSPLDAAIDIDAQYKDLKATPYNFLAEYVDKDDNAKSESQKLTTVELSLKLSGPLGKPDINFDLNFPQLSNTLKSYADSKLRLLRQDQNELNKQVFGLIAVGGFLPTDVQNWSGTQLRSGTLNTLSESVSTFVSGLLNNFLKDFITGLDVEVGYSYYEFDKVDANGRTGAGSQFRLRSTYSLNDHITVSGGVGLENGNYANSTGSDNSFLNYDVIVDYAINKDRRMKVRISYTRDQVFEGKRDKPAVGLRYRREFDSFEELFNSLKKRAKLNNKNLPAENKKNTDKKNILPTF